MQVYLEDTFLCSRLQADWKAKVNSGASFLSVTSVDSNLATFADCSFILGWDTLSTLL
eukprot:m.48721 g.48721  ORF g.48721 m.48721 type:complete len:58 (+) comp33915_c0_seq1:286-459(+)